MKNTKEYDIIIVGGGISGLMCAYNAIQIDPDLKIAIFEKGPGLDNRVCPIVTKKSKTCVKCSSCSIMTGVAGAGAFSDGKYNIGTEYGGWLTNYFDHEYIMKYLYQANDILEKYGAITETYKPNNELKLMCLQNDLHMLQAEVKHLGTDLNLITMHKFTEDLANYVEIYPLSDVTGVDKNLMEVTVETKEGIKKFKAQNIVFAVGRYGSEFLSQWCKDNGVNLHNNQIDIGVRVELPRIIWQSMSKKIYEPKILYRTNKYNDNTRTFCFNDGGSVVIENTDGIITVNGHSYSDESKKTEYSNFAILCTNTFTQPFNEPIEYAKHIAGLANKLSGGSVLIQRFGDLIKGRRTDEARLSKGTTKPTLKAVPGDLSLCLPKRHLDNVIDTIYALDKVAPGTANEDTLLYGVECKYYSARPEMNNFEIENCKNIYAIGDGAGITRSLSQAAASGLIVGEIIANKK